MHRKRDRIDIEWMRIMACVFVMMDHTASCCLYLYDGVSKMWIATTLCFVISKVAVPLFLMITGATLLGKCDSIKKWSQRIGRIFAVLLIGSLVYAAVFAWLQDGSFNVYDVLRQLPQKNVTNAYWYLYLYLGILCLLPILQWLVQTLPVHWLVWLVFLHVGVAGIAILVPVLFPLESVYGVATGNVMFTSYLSLFSPYLGMVLLGYVVERYIQITKKVALAAGIGFISLTIFQIFVEYHLYFGEGRWMNHPAYLFVTLSTFCLYILIKCTFEGRMLPVWVRQAGFRLGSLTFGIYLLSDLAILLTRTQIFVPLSQYIHPFFAWLLWIMCMFLICAGVTGGTKGVWSFVKRQIKTE